jgi:uroporphyrinogen decarboxylase
MTTSPKERWIALLDNRKPDRIPTDYWATDEVTNRLCKDMSCGNVKEMWEKLHIDGLDTISAPRTITHFPDNPNANIWGVTFREVDYGTGVYLEADSHPMAEITDAEQLSKFPWPSPDDHDWDIFRKRIDRLDGYRAVRCGSFEPFLLYCEMRGLEQGLLDLIIEPDIVNFALNRIFDYYYRLNERMFELAKGKVNLTYVAEDLGSQNGLLISLEHIHRFLLPNQKKIADLARSYGIRIFYHTDGAAREAIPDLINITGIDILNPIQWRCPGMERENLVRDFGDKIIFHGAMDNQQTLPFGTPDDVRNEVLENIRIFSNSRWICAPCHNLQPVTPTENIVVMYETIHEYGRF